PQVRQGLPPAPGASPGRSRPGRAPEIVLEYFAVADAATLQPLAAYAPGRAVVLCLAADLGGVRLIDNVVVVF
ncbi:pantoate--beta-alanine ligase, partial [Hymenobacter coccineus]|uniref:pantoate--beta-alanine ligase n=1 Tax=Hymenobacter coccineus TaxID=1908235 RepID=UPI00114CCD2A